MNCNFSPSGKILNVKRAAGSPRIYRESLLFYRLKQLLNNFDFDMVKKEMAKDGHLTSEGRYYVRDRKGKWCAHDKLYMERDICKDYNDRQNIQLTVERWED